MDARMLVKSLQSCLTLCDPMLWTVAHQAPLPMAFSRQEYWNGLLCPPPGESSQCRDQIHVSYVYLHWEVGLFLSLVPPGKPIDWTTSVIKKQGQQRIHFCHNGIWGYGSSQWASKQWHHLCWQDIQGSSWRWCQSEQQSPEAGGKVGAISLSYSAGWFYRWFWLLLSPIFSWSPSDSAVNLFSNPRNDSKPFDKFISSLNQPELISVLCTWEFWH